MTMTLYQPGTPVTVDPDPAVVDPGDDVDRDPAGRMTGYVVRYASTGLVQVRSGACIVGIDPATVRGPL